MVNLPLGKSTEAPLSFKAGTVVFAEGEESKYLYILKKGEIHLMKTNGSHLLVLKLCKEKEILNEVSVLLKKPVEFSAIAKTDIELVLVEQQDINLVLKGSPKWVPEILETLCERLKATQDIIEEHNLSSGEKKQDTILKKDEEIKYMKALAEHNSH
jgi:CRP/FNR family cyclic AMP-dependent transcriptional regulator